MSTGYDASPPPSNYPQFEPRRTSGNIPSSFERPINASIRQRTPSPGSSRRNYDSYVPHYGENTPYRNAYRPNNYRPEPSSYYPRSPSPDGRSTEPAYRGSSWRPPERRPLPPSPTSRRFEPSDSWRHSHGREYVSPSDRHFERRGRSGIDSSPERSPRLDRSHSSPQDRHGPIYFKRETWPAPERRPLMDSYRPQYDERGSTHRRELPHSPTNGSRHESDSLPTRFPDYPEFARPIQRKPSPLLASPAAVSQSSFEQPWSYLPSSNALKRDLPPSPSSRSSIASTHLSDRRSPGVASIPQPSIRLPASLPAKPQAAIDALANDNRRSDTRFGTKAVHSGVVSQVPMNAVEMEIIAKPHSSAVREPTKDIPQKLNIITGFDIRDSSPKDSRAADTTQAVEEQPSVSRSMSPSMSPHSMTSEIPGSPVMPVVQEALPLNGAVVEQPKSKSPVEHPPTARDGVLDVDIPPTTHSPSPPSDPVTAMDTEPADLLAHHTLPRTEDIPPLSSARTMEDALRITVMTRLLRDYQSRDSRVQPVLMANLAIAPPPEVHPVSTPTILFDQMFTGLPRESRRESAAKIRPFLVKYFAHRQAMIGEKTNRLREEYVTLQEHWIAHCSALNEQQRTLASEQENQPPMRTTRRSMAITDAVRSDFEMEQIIASLGNDEATDPNHLSMRNLAKVPDMISAVNGRLDVVFDDNNYLVENPAEYYAPHTGIHDWTDTEKKIFMEKFGAYPKQFGIIADFLPNKTAAQCVAYYYLHKKMFIDFRRVISQYAPNKRRRRGMGRKKGNGLLADIAMHDLEVRGSGSVSPSMSGPAARASRGRKSLNATATLKPPPSRRNPVQFEDTPTSTPTPEPESRSRKRRAASGTSTPVTVPAYPMPAPCPTSTTTSLRISTPSIPVHQPTSVPVLHITTLAASTTAEEDDGLDQEARPVKRARRTRRIKSAMMILDEPASPPQQSVLLPANEVTEPASRVGGKKDRSTSSAIQWSEDDKHLFLSLLSQYGTDFRQIAAFMHKTPAQVSTFYKSNQSMTNLAELASKAPKIDNSLWSTFPASESKQMSPPATLMTTIKPQPMSSLGYNSSRNAYPPTSSPSTTAFTTHATSGDVPPPAWNGPPLPTRISQHPGYSVAPLAQNTSSVSGRGDSSHPSSEIYHTQYSSSGNSATVQYPYTSRNPPPSDSSHGYSTGRYPEDHHPPVLPSRQPRSGIPPPQNLPAKASQDYRHPPKPRISTSNYPTSPPPHSSSSTGLPPPGFVPVSSTSPGPAPGAAAIIHSPTLSSPKLRQTPSPYAPFPPQPSRGSDPKSISDSREHLPRNPPPVPHTSVNPQSHSRQRSDSYPTSWAPPGASERYYGPVGPPPPLPSVSFGGRPRGASDSSQTDSRDSTVHDRKREPYPTFPPANSNPQTDHPHLYAPSSSGLRPPVWWQR